MKPGRRPPTRSVFALLAMVCSFVSGMLLTGCAESLKTHKEAAQNRWDGVRGRIKLQLAQGQYDAGRIQDAEIHLKEALGLDPTSPQAHILLAKICIEKGELVAARTALDTARAHGDAAEIDYLSGVLAQRYGDREAALSHYRAAAQREPQCAPCVVAEAESLVALGRLSEALELIRSRATDFERNATLRSLAGDIHTMLGQYEQAADAYREAVLLAPNDVQLQIQLGTSLERAGRHGEAVAVLAPLLPRTPDAPWSARLALGKACLANGNATAAKDVFRIATRNAGASAEPWTWLARAALACDDRMTARQAAEKAASLTPQNGSCWLLLGYVCHRQNDIPAARRALDAALRLNPEDPLAHCLAGRLCETSGRRRDALEHYTRALAADPGCQWARELLAAAEPAGTARDTTLP